MFIQAFSTSKNVAKDFLPSFSYKIKAVCLNEPPALAWSKANKLLAITAMLPSPRPGRFGRFRRGGFIGSSVFPFFLLVKRGDTLFRGSSLASFTTGRELIGSVTYMPYKTV